MVLKVKSFFLTVLLLNIVFSVNAQSVDIENLNMQYCQVDDNLVKVIEPSGNYFHVTKEGVRHGAFFMNENINDYTIVSAKGQMNNGKYFGRIIYSLNGEISLIRVYDEIGTLTKTTRIHGNSVSLKTSLLAQN